MNAEFSGRVALITGGTGGLGIAVSLAFLQSGANVVVTYRDEAEFVALKRQAENASGCLSGTVVDVTDQDAVAGLVRSIATDHGGLDILVNTVGGYAGGKALWKADESSFDRMMTLNLRAGYRLLRAVIPTMLERKRGAIVNVSGRAGVDHPAGAAGYAAAKAAAIAMIDSVAADLKGSGVRVNSILPSVIDTAANRKAMPSADFAKWPKPDDIAQVILFLCSDAARVIHGAAIPVYGSD